MSDGRPAIPQPSSLLKFRADAAVAAVLVKFRGMTPEQAVAEVRRMKERP